MRRTYRRAAISSRARATPASLTRYFAMCSVQQQAVHRVDQEVGVLLDGPAALVQQFGDGHVREQRPEDLGGAVDVEPRAQPGLQGTDEQPAVLQPTTLVLRPRLRDLGVPGRGVSEDLEHRNGRRHVGARHVPCGGELAGPVRRLDDPDEQLALPERHLLVVADHRPVDAREQQGGLAALAEHRLHRDPRLRGDVAHRRGGVAGTEEAPGCGVEDGRPRPLRLLGPQWRAIDPLARCPGFTLASPYSLYRYSTK